MKQFILFSLIALLFWGCCGTADCGMDQRYYINFNINHDTSRNGFFIKGGLWGNTYALNKQDTANYESKREIIIDNGRSFVLTSGNGVNTKDFQNNNYWIDIPGLGKRIYISDIVINVIFDKGSCGAKCDRITRFEYKRDGVLHVKTDAEIAGGACDTINKN